jgi:hypothetical protein
MSRHRASQVALLCLLCNVFSGNARSEPLTTGAGTQPPALASDEEPQPRRPGNAEPLKFVTPGVIDRSAVGSDGPSASKTVELLLEMQGKNPGLEGGERPKAEMPTTRPSAGAAAAAKPAFGADVAPPFGAAETLRGKPPGTEPQAVDWSGAPPSGLGGGGLSAGGSTPRDPYRPGAASERSADEDDVRWLIPRRLIRFVRENRDMVVLGSVGLLLLLWVVTAISARRRK